MTNNTTLSCDKQGYVIVARLIKHNYTIIEFRHDIEAHKLCNYFTMPDDDFLKLGRRVKVDLSDKLL